MAAVDPKLPLGVADRPSLVDPSRSYAGPSRPSAVPRHRPFGRLSPMGEFGQFLPFKVAAEIYRERSFASPRRSSGRATPVPARRVAHACSSNPENVLRGRSSVLIRPIVLPGIDRA